MTPRARCRLKLVLAVLLVLFTAVPGHAENESFTSLVRYEEVLRLPGCEPYRGRGVLQLTVHRGLLFELTTDAGIFSGLVRRKGGAMHLAFDDPSLTLYAHYLRAGTSVLCRREAAIRDGVIRTAIVRLRKDGTVSLRLRTKVLAEADRRAIRGNHRITGRGTAEPIRREGGGVILLPGPV